MMVHIFQFKEPVDEREHKLKNKFTLNQKKIINMIHVTVKNIRNICKSN